MRAVIFDLDHTIFATEITLRDGVRDLLAILQRLGVAVGGLSNTDERTLARLEGAGVRGYFDTVLCADQGLEPKEVTGIQHLLYLLGVQPEESVLVSHAHSDILLGKAAGLQRTIGVAHGKHAAAPLAKAGADHIVPNIPAILDALE